MIEHRLIVITNHWPRAELHQRRITPLNANYLFSVQQRTIVKEPNSLAECAIALLGPIPCARIALRVLDGESVRERRLLQAFKHMRIGEVCFDGPRN